LPKAEPEIREAIKELRALKWTTDAIAAYLDRSAESILQFEARMRKGPLKRQGKPAKPETLARNARIMAELKAGKRVCEVAKAFRLTQHHVSVIKGRELEKERQNSKGQTRQSANALNASAN